MVDDWLGWRLFGVTAGWGWLQETSNPDRYLKWAHAFIVVYSITSQQSMDAARNYLETISQYQRITGKDIPISLVGNKTDLERYR